MNDCFSPARNCGPRHGSRPGWAWRGLLCAVLATLALPARAGTLVNFNFTNFGSVQVDLFDDLTPGTVTNFVQHYLTPGRYNDSMIHRVDTGLGVIQGGGFTSQAQAIATSADPLIPLEYSRANTRGTIAMARFKDPNDTATSINTSTASSQWFINTKDNSTNLNQANGGGYAVFGWVVGPGMTVVDSIAAVPTFAFSDPFGQVPLQNFTAADQTNGVNPIPHVVILNSATVVKTHPSYQNPFLATDVNNSGTLSATDALTVINDLLVHGNHALTAPFAGTDYLDVNGSGTVSATDALLVVNALLHAGTSPQVSPFALANADPMLIVPEPSSLVLGSMAVLALPACWAARRYRSRRPRRLGG
jgi:peptidyl-prolyl cis-trans isomerase A (cyclophilin A)